MKHWPRLSTSSLSGHVLCVILYCVLDLHFSNQVHPTCNESHRTNATPRPIENFFLTFFVYLFERRFRVLVSWSADNIYFDGG